MRITVHKNTTLGGGKVYDVNIYTKAGHRLILACPTRLDADTLAASFAAIVEAHSFTKDVEVGV